MTKASLKEQKILNILTEDFSDNTSDCEDDSVTEENDIIEKPKQRKEYVMTDARKEGLKKAQEKRREIGQQSRDIKEAKKLLPKPKKTATETQLANLKKGQDNLNIRREQKRLEREIEMEEEKKRQEELIVKKALSIKKKQIKKQAILDAVSDDDTPVEKIKEIAKRIPVKKTIDPKPLEPLKPVNFYDQFKFV